MPHSSSVCVVSLMRNGSYDDSYPRTALLRNKLAYCQRCGYRCYLLNDHYMSSRSPGWDKLLALRDVLEKECSVALWLDADVVVLRPFRMEPLARTPISATKDFYGFNTGVMLLSKSEAASKLLRAAWEQTEFVPNRLGAEQSAVRYVLHTNADLKEATTIYGNLVRYPVQLAVSARVKWNITLRLAAPLFHTAGCSMTQKSSTCSTWLQHQLSMAQKNWEGQPDMGGKCVTLDVGDALPRKPKTSDNFIPFGQGRDVLLKSEDATRQELVAVRRIERKACLFALRKDMCKQVNRTAATDLVSVAFPKALEARTTDQSPHANAEQPQAVSKRASWSIREWALASRLGDILNGTLLNKLELLGDTVTDIAHMTDADWEQSLRTLPLKLGQRRRVQSAINAMRMRMGTLRPTSFRRLQDAPQGAAQAAFRIRPQFAMLTFVTDGRSYDRDRDPIALMSCFAREHGVPYYIESHDYGSKWYNKHHALRKYLPHFEWLLYVDSDTYVVDRVHGYQALLNMTAMLDSGGYHIAISELHHSGAGGFDAGAMLLKGSSTGLRLVEEWSKGEEREYRNADNGFLHILFLRWILGAAYDGRCDHHLYKNQLKSSNGTMVSAREFTTPTIQAYNGFFPCFYGALGLPSGTMKMRKINANAADGRHAWRPFFVMHWDEPGILSCAYPRRPTPQMTASPISCKRPVLYHGKDISKRFWRGTSGCDNSSV